MTDKGTMIDITKAIAIWHLQMSDTAECFAVLYRTHYCRRFSLQWISINQSADPVEYSEELQTPYKTEEEAIHYTRGVFSMLSIKATGALHEVLVLLPCSQKTGARKTVEEVKKEIRDKGIDLDRWRNG
jgi:hypothetical protein